MLFSTVDSFTPLDRIPVEGRQEYVVKQITKTDGIKVFRNLMLCHHFSNILKYCGTVFFKGKLSTLLQLHTLKMHMP
jgi:hypothetical protein